MIGEKGLRRISEMELFVGHEFPRMRFVGFSSLSLLLRSIFPFDAAALHPTSCYVSNQKHRAYLLHHFLPHLELFLVGEGNPVETLQGIVFGVSQPIGGRMLRGSKGFDLTGVRNVGTTAQIDEIAISVNGGAGSVGDLRGQDFDLEGVVGEQLEGLVLGDYHALEFLFLLDDFLYFFFDGFVCFREVGLQ